MAAIIPRMKPAFKVAGNSPRKISGRNFTGVIIDEVSPKNPWEPYRLKIFPKKINEHWYSPGDMVYRRFVFSPGGGYWVYGDDLDYLKWQP
jgi:hypothetical protein